MGSYYEFLLQKLSSLIHTASLFLIPLFSYLYRWKKLEVLWNNKDDKGMVFLEAERGGDNLHLKFKFPTFEEFSRVHKGSVLTTSPPRDIKNGEVGKADDETVEEEAAAVESKVEETEERDVDLGESMEEAKKRVEEQGGELESLWEHQELIEQLQMELRKVKASGLLPTILEESESPNLKPWKIEDRDCMGELHSMHKTYQETMRKFDILNYQKMYAMGFLQLKPISSSPPLLNLKSLFRRNRSSRNPMKKVMKELEAEVEVVYVGQMCLSWEFLHWQYRKALELWNSDPHGGGRRYNDVAGEFQQFQVLLQRFTEDQPFQGPRLHTYVKTRCVLRNLLQVPLIREDWLEGERREEDEYGMMSSEMVVEMVEESIRIFWQFVRSDKDCSSHHNKLSQINTPQDHKLLIELRKILLKKEKKVKDALRSERCILKKLRKRREEEEEDDSEQALKFFAQVDVKLVCRVLNMSRISRDQLVWCQNKLNRISFVNRKIYVEPAFLLFPC